MCVAQAYPRRNYYAPEGLKPTHKLFPFGNQVVWPKSGKSEAKYLKSMCSLESNSWPLHY